MRKFYKNDKKLLLIAFERSDKYLIVVIISFDVSTMFYSLDVIQLINSHKYDDKSSVLCILIVVVYLLFISGANNTLLHGHY